MIKKAKSIITKYFENTDVNLYHCCMQAGSLLVIIDSTAGIKLSDCAQHARKLVNLLQLQDIDLELEVTSPGIDRKLYTKEHYILAQDEQIVCCVREEVMGKKKLHGILLDVNDDDFVMREADSEESLKIAFSNVRKTNVDA